MTEFELLQGDEGRTFLKVFDGTVHIVLELDEMEITELQDTLYSSPTNFDSEDFK